jgi:hypothetical protein
MMLPKMCGNPGLRVSTTGYEVESVCCAISSARLKLGADKQINKRKKPGTNNWDFIGGLLPTILELFSLGREREVKNNPILT